MSAWLGECARLKPNWLDKKEYPQITQITQITQIRSLVSEVEWLVAVWISIGAGTPNLLSQLLICGYAFPLANFSHLFA